jgi:hypothetical protein
MILNRRDLLRAGVFGGALSLVPSSVRAAGADPQPAGPTRRKKLIAWGGIDWYSPETVQNNIETIEQLPFDGTVLSGFKMKHDGKDAFFDWLCFGKERFERAQLADTIATLRNTKFRAFTDNFLRYNVTPGDVDWFEDSGAILHNARMWAGVTRGLGMKGWIFDVEDYKGTVFNYAKVKSSGQKSFEEYAAQARQRGRQFMDAVQEGYPGITLILALAHSYVLNGAPDAAKKLAELEYGLLPAFINGLLEAAGPGVQLIDGSEQSYVYLTAEDFYRGYHASRQQALELVPPDLHVKYRQQMESGMAI